MNLQEERKGLMVGFSNSLLLSALLIDNRGYRKLEQARGDVSILVELWTDCFKPDVVEFFKNLKKDRASGLEDIFVTKSSQVPLVIKFTSQYNKRTVDRVKKYFKDNH